MKAAVAFFAAGALAMPSAHNHEHLHRRHAKPDVDMVYNTEIVTNTVVQYVNANGAPVNAGPPTQAPAPPAQAPPAQAPAPAPASNSEFATMVTAASGEKVSAMAWNWGNPNGAHGVSWRYSVPAENSQPTSHAQAPPAYTAAPSSQPAAQPAPQPAPSSYQAPAPAPAPQSSSAAAPAPSQGGSLSSWQQTIVDTHNYHRDNHSVPHVQWSDSLAAAAQAVAAKCSFTHDLSTNKDSCGFDSYGQNFACTSGSDNIGQDISAMWYNEEGLYAQSGSYGQANPNPTAEETGHFTQLIWKGTTHVGCAVQQCDGGVSGTSGMKELTVCDYGPEGNMGGEYADNVPEPTKNMASIKDAAPAGYN